MSDTPRIADPDYRMAVLQTLLEAAMKQLDRAADNGKWDRYAAGEARVVLKEANRIAEPSPHLDVSKTPAEQLLERLALHEQLAMGLLRDDVDDKWVDRARSLLDEIPGDGAVSGIDAGNGETPP